jgi:cardiolipin synthase
MEKPIPFFFTVTNEAWEAMLEECEKAEVSIDMEQYIFTNDNIGKRFLEILIQKKKAGVKIRIICDTVGSYFFYNSPIPDNLRAMGIEIKFFNIISPWRIHNIFSWYFRNHRKILVIDGRVAIVGGSGIREDMKFWRDTNVKIDGLIAKEVQESFNEMWLLAGERNIFTRIKRYRKQNKRVHFVTNAPYPRKRLLYHRFIRALRSSKKSILLTTPYFVPNTKLLDTLKSAVRRGVEVKIIVPQTSDTILVNRASHSFFKELLLAGIKIYQYPHFFIHAKTALVDDEWVTIGSFNFDNLSFLYNHEANIVSQNPDFIFPIKKHFEEDLTKCIETNIETWKKRPILWKMREFFAIPLRRFL